MNEPPTILVINPGSTSTRSALYEGQTLVAEELLTCDPVALAACERIIDQKDLRTRHVTDFLARIERTVADCDAVAARGGPLQPCPGGVYRVNDSMLRDAAHEKTPPQDSPVSSQYAMESRPGTYNPPQRFQSGSLSPPG